MEKKIQDGSGRPLTEPQALKPISEVKAAIDALARDARYEGSSALGDFECEVTETKRDGFRAYLIRIVEMYERPLPRRYNGNILAFFKDIEKAAGSNNIALADEINESGCETCDHGSRYGWEFLVWNTPSDENKISERSRREAQP